MSRDFTDIETLTLAKLMTENAVKAVRPGVKPGTYVVNFTVHFEGELTVGEDGEQRPTSNLFSLHTFALLFQRMGIQRDAALALLKEVATDYLNAKQTVGEGLLPYIKDFEGFATEYGKMLESLPKIKKQGSCSAQKVVRTVIETEPSEPTTKPEVPAAPIKVSKPKNGKKPAAVAP